MNIHLADYENHKNFCGARQQLEFAKQTAWTGTGQMIHRSGARPIAAYPRGIKCAKVATIVGAEDLVSLTFFAAPDSKGERVLVPTERLCPACFLFFTVLTANKFKSKRQARLLLKSLEEDKSK